MIEEKEIILLTENLHLLTKDQAWYYRILPKSKTNTRLNFYCGEDADNLTLEAELEILLDSKIGLETLPQTQISRACFPNTILKITQHRVHRRFKSIAPTIF